MQIEYYDITRVNNFLYKNAWILPDGTFYGCKIGEHDDVSFLHFGYKWSEVEKMGWVRINEKYPFFQFRKRLNVYQIKTIIDYYELIGAKWALKLFEKQMIEKL